MCQNDTIFYLSRLSEFEEEERVSKYLRGTVREIIGMRKGVKELSDSV